MLCFLFKCPPLPLSSHWYNYTCLWIYILSSFIFLLLQMQLLLFCTNGKLEIPGSRTWDNNTQGLHDVSQPQIFHNALLSSIKCHCDHYIFSCILVANTAGQRVTCIIIHSRRWVSLKHLIIKINHDFVPLFYI